MIIVANYSSDAFQLFLQRCLFCYGIYSQHFIIYDKIKALNYLSVLASIVVGALGKAQYCHVIKSEFSHFSSGNLESGRK